MNNIKVEILTGEKETRNVKYKLIVKPVKIQHRFLCFKWYKVVNKYFIESEFRYILGPFDNKEDILEIAAMCNMIVEGLHSRPKITSSEVVGITRED